MMMMERHFIFLHSVLYCYQQMCNLNSCTTPSHFRSINIRDKRCHRDLQVAFISFSKSIDSIRRMLRNELITTNSSNRCIVNSFAQGLQLSSTINVWQLFIKARGMISALNMSHVSLCVQLFECVWEWQKGSLLEMCVLYFWKFIVFKSRFITGGHQTVSTQRRNSCQP